MPPRSCTRVADHFSALANENHIQFIVETPPALAVQTDLDKLQRILLNLLSNAFKFTPGGGRVRLSLREDGSRFRVEVADSGPGIPVDKREAVFERFEQLEADPTRPRAGTGLGLSIVRDFAALLGGSASVGDAPEGGALFRRGSAVCRAAWNGRSTGTATNGWPSRRQAARRRASQATSGAAARL